MLPKLSVNDRRYLGLGYSEVGSNGGLSLMAGSVPVSNGNHLISRQFGQVIAFAMRCLAFISGIFFVVRVSPILASRLSSHIPLKAAI